MSILNTILTLVFPVNCAGCGSAGTDLCIDCISSFRGAERESEEWIFPLYDYRDLKLRSAIWQLKYRRKRPLARAFAALLYNRVLEELSDLGQLENFRDPLLIPIPLSRARLRERGFNQSELICRELIREDGGQHFRLEKNTLIRPKDSEHQARIENRSERLKNIIGTFAVKNPQRIKNRNIILIDDVTTTGATLTEARKVLKSAGAKKVMAFTVAH